MLNGFGLERLGIAAIRNPVAATFLLVIVTIVAVIGILRVEFSGENIEILRDNSQEMADYDETPWVISAISTMMPWCSCGCPTWQPWRESRHSANLTSNSSLMNGWKVFFRYFSLVRYGGPETGWESALPAEFESDEAVKQALIQLTKGHTEFSIPFQQ